jgi:exoribonuclease-2
MEVFKAGALAVYKNRPVLVCSKGEKIEIELPGGARAKVRDKDIELLHPGPAKSLPDTESQAWNNDSALREAWELLLDEGKGVSLEILSELAYGDFTPQTAWQAWLALHDGLYFISSPEGIVPRPGAEVNALEQKRNEKQEEEAARQAFLKRLASGSFDENDRRYLQDVEALAKGQSDKSRTLRDLKRSETPAEAQRLLLDSGAWTPLFNPYPARFNLPPRSSAISIAAPPEEERQDLTHLPAYAIDNAYSNDPDDALSIEEIQMKDGSPGLALYVHVADPAAAILPGSPADVEARNRGATCYLPEGALRMMSDEALPLYALGLHDTSPALTFKLSLRPDVSIETVDIFPSKVAVSRLTYAEADEGQIPQPIQRLLSLAEQNKERRTKNGAIHLDFPEVHIWLQNNQVQISPNTAYRSADMVRECMLLAGEGAALWASRRGLAFPYITQETGDLPNEALPGLAGAYQLRRCMRPRQLSTKPGRHAGLGLEAYTQVTSPLRRYIDLIAHQQIRSALHSGIYHDIPALEEDEMMLRIGAADASYAATVQAERASKSYWTMVYLSDKIDSEWDAVVLEVKNERRGGQKAQVLIPALGLETSVLLKEQVEVNDTLRLLLTTVRIPELEAFFETR